MINKSKIKMKNCNIFMPNTPNCYNNVDDNRNYNSNNSRSAFINEKNYIEYILKMRKKNDKNLISNISKSNFDNKNNTYQGAHNLHNKRHNHSSEDDLERLLQLDNDCSFAVSGLETV